MILFLRWYCLLVNEVVQKHIAGSANGEEKSPVASALSPANMCELSSSSANEFRKKSVYTVHLAVSE